MEFLWISLFHTSSCILCQIDEHIGLCRDLVILTTITIFNTPWVTLTLAHHFGVNDIVVLGPEQFYATRDHYFTSLFLTRLKMIVDLR